MHWLIPAVSHSLSTLFAWIGGSLTLPAVLASFLLAASQSTHPWPAFYGLFALFFLSGTLLNIFYPPKSSNGRSSFFLIANVVVASAVVPLHQYYLKVRLGKVPWFHAQQSRWGCLPIPSRTLTEPFTYGMVDAFGNQLPYGAVVSYAAAMAHTFSVTIAGRRSDGMSMPAILAAAVGALLASVTAAYSLPMCEPKDASSSPVYVAMHMDRSLEWQERTPLTWSSQMRYGSFIVMMTLAGTTGAVIAEQMAAAFRARRATSKTPGKPTLRPRDAKGHAVTEKAGTESAVDKRETLDSHMASLCMNILVTAAVVLAMAVWSYTGPRVPQEREQPTADSVLQGIDA